MNHDATAADGRAVPQVLAQQLRVPRTLARSVCRQVDHVGGVHVDPRASLCDRRRASRQICVADGQLAALRRAQEDLVGLAEVAEAEDGLAQRLALGHVAADEVRVAESSGHASTREAGTLARSSAL